MDLNLDEELYNDEVAARLRIGGLAKSDFEGPQHRVAFKIGPNGSMVADTGVPVHENAKALFRHSSVAEEYLQLWENIRGHALHATDDKVQMTRWHQVGQLLDWEESIPCGWGLVIRGRLDGRTELYWLQGDELLPAYEIERQSAECLVVLEGIAGDLVNGEELVWLHPTVGPWAYETARWFFLWWAHTMLSQKFPGDVLLPPEKDVSGVQVTPNRLTYGIRQAIVDASLAAKRAEAAS